MGASELTTNSPAALRFLAYLNERFPAWQMPLVLPAFLTAFFVGQTLTARPAKVTAGTAVGLLAFAALGLVIRALDDIKDIEHDNAHYPERVLQRGLITPSHLRILGAGCFAFSLAGSILIDRGIGLATWWWLISVGGLGVYQFSMIRSRSLYHWIEERRVLFALTIAPFPGLDSLWIAQMGAGTARMPWSAGWLAAMWITGPLLLEIVRKTYSPDDERPTVVDYAKPREAWTQSLGLNGSVAVMVGLGAITTVLELVVLRATGHGSSLAYAAVASVFVALMLPVSATFVLHPSRERVKTVGQVSAIALILGQTVLALAMLMR